MPVSIDVLIKIIFIVRIADEIYFLDRNYGIVHILGYKDVTHQPYDSLSNLRMPMYICHRICVLDDSLPRSRRKGRRASADRTPQVSKAILIMLSNVSDCASITMSDLADIFVLDLSNVTLSALQADDFDGLSNLTDLDLQNNQLSTLPESIFSNLQRLNRIRLGNNKIEELPDGVFSNLPSLNRLGLNNNQLKTLSDNLFANVPNLFELDLRGNQLGYLSNNMFDNLSVLTTLGLDRENLDNPSFLIPTTVKRLQLSAAPIPEVVFQPLAEQPLAQTPQSSTTIWSSIGEEGELSLAGEVGEWSSARLGGTESGVIDNTPPSTFD